MSIAIDIDHVTRVLMADGWHDVLAGSFTCDAFEFVWKEGQADKDRGYVWGVPACSVGMEWQELRGPGIVFVSAPLSSLIAVEVEA